MRDTGGKGSLTALITLKLVCCGGLLLATGAFSLGGLLSLIDQPAVKIGGVLLLVLAVGWFLRRALSIRSTHRSQNEGGHAHEHRRDIA
jgi:membrane protein implicated in regulation of membrane protease activity